MTTEKIIALAKEKLGKDITEQEAKDYLEGTIALPDEALELVGGGSGCSDEILTCPKCGSNKCHGLDMHIHYYVCRKCGTRFRYFFGQNK